MGLPGDTLVFDRENGEPWNVNELSLRWSRFVRRTKLPTLRWHDLRHGFASLSHDAGESLHSISTALGHSSIGITSSTYVHTFDETKRRRAERLDAYLSPTVRDKNVTIEGLESTKSLIPVGTRITARPLDRSGRADYPHPALIASI